MGGEAGGGPRVEILWDGGMLHCAFAAAAGDLFL